MNSNSVSILERIKQERKKHNSIDGRCDNGLGADGPANGPIENPETAIQKLKDIPFDLKKNINCEQKIEDWWSSTTPMIAFCQKGDILMCRFLKQHGASGTKRDSESRFPMYIAAFYGQFEICQWLYNVGGGAAEDINKVWDGRTPLSKSICNRHVLQSQWFVLHGGAQQLCEEAVARLQQVCRIKELGGPELICWVHDQIQFHTTYLKILNGTRVRTSSSSSLSSSSSSSTAVSNNMHTHTHNLPLLNGQSGVMELISHYAGLIYGKEIRMLQEFIVLVE